MTRIGRGKVFRLSGQLFALQSHDLPIVAHLLGKHAQSATVFDEAPNGRDCWAMNVFHFAESLKRRMDFFFAEIGMLPTETFNLGDNFFLPVSFSFCFRRSFLFVKCFRFTPSFNKLLFPIKERATFYLKSFDGCCQTVFSPEGKNAGSLKSLFGNHISIP